MKHLNTPLSPVSPFDKKRPRALSTHNVTISIKDSFATSSNEGKVDPNTDIFSTLSLSADVRRIFEMRNVKTFYDWQKQCLSDPRLLNGQNFILSLPTGAGKTLVAELLMLRCLLKMQKSCILILPFVAIVQEKVVSLGVFEDYLRFSIEEYANTKGRIPPLKRKENSLYVCTIEKANVLVNSLISENRLDEIGLVVVDELHMLGEERRGNILEQCLTKVITQNPMAQIIGMSATLSSVPHLKKFLSAEVFSTEFRPIQLKEYVKVNNSVYQYFDAEEKYEHVRDCTRILSPKVDPDNLIPLVAEVIPKKSVLIFCPTKQNTENLCSMLSRNIPKEVKDYRRSTKEDIVKQIIESNEGLICPVMEAGIYAGVAYHHSGLTREERMLVESAFKDGTLCIICATSTLAAGVNLPARRVIVRSPRIGRDHLGKSNYLQMIGRAGRAGLDDEGESFIILQDGKEKKEFIEMRKTALPPCKSGFADPDMLEAFVLDLLALGVCKDIGSLRKAINRTLFDAGDEDAMKALDAVLTSLVTQGMVDKSLTITPLGMASSKGSVVPAQAPVVFNELVKTLDKENTKHVSPLKGVVLSSHFHLLCVIVPYDTELPQVDFNIFYREYKKLSKGEKSLLTSWGITEALILKYFTVIPKLSSSHPIPRVYTAFMLKAMWTADANAHVAEEFKVSRGWLNSILQSACTYANQLGRFVNEIPELWACRQLLPDLLQRLNMCNSHELVPLLGIDCVRRSRAKLLFDAGFRTVGAISRATPEELTKKVQFLGLPQAKRIVSSAKTLFRDLIAEKAAELETIGAETVDINRSLVGANVFETLENNAIVARKRSPSWSPMKDESEWGFIV